jgi:UDP-N-acetyl-D-mannosaminouronate:lipid I N-acetyl-D-mannosaminouronosyltransferase
MNKVKVVEVDGIGVQLYKSIDIAVQDIFSNYIGTSSSAVAINPEKIMLARTQSIVRNVLMNNEIRYPDGIGVVKLLSHKANTGVARIPGCELWEAIMKEAGKKNTAVFLVGAKSNTINQVVNKLSVLYSTNIVGFQDGYFEDEELLIQKILNAKAQIVTVALGSPKQELFIEKCRKAGIDAFFMGVGGTYDVFTGNVKRAPKLFCKLGLEWFYRLLSQPTRILRQKNLLKFLWLSLNHKL